MDGGGRILHLPRREAPHPITLDDVQRSEELIMRYLRHTPLMQTWLRCRDGKRIRVSLKLENLQITENYAVRGMLNAALRLPSKQLAKGLVGYGLMYGPAVAYVGHVLSVPSLVLLYPAAATDEMVRTLQYWGAKVEIVGKSLAETEKAAFAHAERHGQTCIHASANPAFIAGCATIAQEMLEFAPHLEVLVSAVGLGPLIAGMAACAKQIKPSVRVVGVDRMEPRNGYPYPADVDHTWRRHRLGSILERAEPLSLELADRYAEDIVLVSQAEIMEAAHGLWNELEIRTGSFGSSAVAALQLGRIEMEPWTAVGAVITRAGGDGLF